MFLCVQIESHQTTILSVSSGLKLHDANSGEYDTEYLSIKLITT